MAKVERAEAIENLAEVIEASDVVMVARGDLGVEIGDAELPGLQKKIIRESGSRLLEADEWLREMYDSTEDTIKHCDEMIAQVDALETRRGGKAKKQEGEA